MALPARKRTCFAGTTLTAIIRSMRARRSSNFAFGMKATTLFEVPADRHDPNHRGAELGLAKGQSETQNQESDATPCGEKPPAPLSASQGKERVVHIDL